MDAPAAERARFVARENRFVVRARRPDGTEVRAYLPNTARLTDLLREDAELVLEPTEDPTRRTGHTVTRVWDGTWVALHAGAASDLVAAHLAAGGRLPGWPAVMAVRREVPRCGHRFDLEVDLADGRSAIVEVKSLSRGRGGVAPLSSTPSTRAVAQLRTLRRLVADVPVAVAFVVQRGDVEELDLAAAADPVWTAAVREAAAAGVHVVAFACHVDERTTRLGRSLRVTGRQQPARGRRG